MSRSFRKNKIFGWSASESEKKDKKICNRKMRRYNKHILQEDVEEEFMTQDEAMDKYQMSKDGKQYWGDATKRDLSK